MESFRLGGQASPPSNSKSHKKRAHHHYQRHSMSKENLSLHSSRGVSKTKDTTMTNNTTAKKNQSGISMTKSKSRVS